jgi:hypothetical protein
LNHLETHLKAQVDEGSDFFWHRLRWKVVSEVLTAHPPTAVADIGAGAGLLAGYLARDYPALRYLFEEPLESLEKLLVSSHGAESNVRGKPVLAAEIVTLLDVLEHQEDDRAFLRELSARMQPGARIIVTVPALRSLWSPWDEALGHFRRYTKASLASAFETQPLVLEEMSYLFPELVPAALLRKGVRKRQDPAEGGSEFPQLPSSIDNALYRVGSATLRLRKRSPFGSSLVAVARRI